jgi:fructokinase
MAKVLCPGELLIDFFCLEKGTTLKQGETFLKKAGGAPANVAVAIQKLGAEGIVLSAVGNDPFGAFLIDTLNKYNVNTSGIVQLDTNTTFAFVSLQQDGERDFTFLEGAATEYTFKMIPDHLLDADIFHFGSAMAFMNKPLEKTYYQLVAYAQKHNKVITFDPNYRDVIFANNISYFIKHSRAFIALADVVKVSEEEALLISEKNNLEDAITFLLEIGAKYIITTLGKNGSILASKDKQVHIPVIPVKMVDATGAGDAFIGAILAKMAHAKNIHFDTLKEFIEFGNKVGAITVQQYGALDSIPMLKDVK